MATDPVATESGTESGTEFAASLPRTAERLVVAALAVVAFALNLNTHVLGALLPFLRSDDLIGPGDAEYLISAGALGTAVGALAVGAMSQRFGRRATLLIGLGLFVVGSLGHLVSVPFWCFLLLRALSGAAAGLAYAAASALAAQVTPYARRGAAMGWFTAGMFLAVPVGMSLTVILARAGHWQSIFALQALVAAVAGICALRIVPAGVGVEQRARWVGVLKNPGVGAALVSTMLHVGSFFTTVQLATTWLNDTGRVRKEDQLWLWIGLGLLSVVGSAAFGRFSDRVGKRLFVLVCSAILCACYALLSRDPDPLVLLIVAAILSLAAAARTGPLQALISGLVPAGQLSALMGMRSAAMQIGTGVIALLAKPVAGELGFQGVLLLAAACQALSYAAVRFGVAKA